jgi:protein-S-isoprenylcysteine O-methyltransferase Ste14
MERSFAVRAIALYAPAMLVALPWALRGLPRRRAVAVLLASAWNVPALLFVNVMAIRFGWWTFAPTRVSIANVPVDLLLGWILLWGAVPVVLVPRLALSGVVGLFTLLDLGLMPLATPVLVLGDWWLLGELAALLVALVPGQLLARWTADDRRVGDRAALQAIAFTAIVLWVLPAVIVERGFASWVPLVTGWNRWGGVPLQLALVPALMGLSAVQEFATRGRGTPLPFDPPKRLVTSGPYAYVANPMQLSLALVLVAWGAILHSAWIALGGVMAVAYGVGLADADERKDLDARFGGRWRSYRSRVRAWRPRWRPYHGSDDGGAGQSPAVLYVAASCGPCSEVGQWFAARRPVGLEIVAAESHPKRNLTRITYDPRDGSEEETGVAAVARALEHINLGWALAGSMMRLPGLRPVLQLLTDASGGNARVLGRPRPT